MDIICPKCAEHWDFDELHEIAEELIMDDYNGLYSKELKAQGREVDYPAYFNKARKLFQQKGCEAFHGRHNVETLGSLKAQASAAIMDLMGSDIDGAAATLEDFEYLGMLDE